MTTKIVGGTLLDPSEGDVVDNPGLTIKDGVITSVGRDDSSAERTIEISGTILPGLVNLHEHFTFRATYGPPFEVLSKERNEQVIRAVRNAHLSVARGITTVRELGSRFGINHSIRDAVNQGILIGPRVFSSGSPLAITGGHAWYISTEVNGTAQIRAAVRELAKSGSDWVKIMASDDPVETDHEIYTRPDFSSEELKCIVAEAHARGMRVTAHCMGPQSIAWCLEAGVDTLEHGVYMTDDLAEEMKRAGTRLIPTVSSYRRTVDERYQRGERWRRLHEPLIDPHTDSARRAIEAGVEIGIGTDSIGEFVEELEILTNLGMNPTDCLRSATTGGAEILGIADKLGSINTGKVADLVVVDGNPLEDLTALRQTQMVFLDGQPFRPEDFTGSLSVSDLPSGDF